MKKIYILPLLGALLAGCEKDHSENLPQLTDRSYEGLTELNLIYDNAPMVGKTATFSDNILTFDSKVDPGSVSEALKALPPLPGPGVLPGTPVLPIRLNLMPNKDKFSFAGSDETEYVTYSYLGSITDSRLDFNFYNVHLKDTRLSSRVFKPTEADSKTGASPFHIVWETSQPGLLEFFDGSVQDALRLIADLPLFPAYNNTAYMSATQVISSGVTSISFNPDGNMVVTYLQKANGAAQFAQAPICMLQYLPVENNNLRLFVNPTDLISVILMNNTNKPEIPENPFANVKSRAGESGTAADGASAGSLLDLLSPEEIQFILTNAAPMLSQGLPMKFDLTENSMELYVPTEILLPLVRNVIAPVLAKPEVQQLIAARVEENAALRPYLPLVKGMLLALPLILETTTRAELGLSLSSL